MSRGLSEEEEIEKIETELSNGSNIDEYKHGVTRLYRAARQGKARVVSFLLTNGAAHFEEHFNGFTPLHVAAQEGHPSVVKTLLRFGIQPDLMDNRANTPLYIAAQYDRPKIVKLLVESGATVYMSCTEDLYQMWHNSPGDPLKRQEIFTTLQSPATAIIQQICESLYKSCEKRGGLHYRMFRQDILQGMLKQQSNGLSAIDEIERNIDNAQMNPHITPYIDKIVTRKLIKHLKDLTIISEWQPEENRMPSDVSRLITEYNYQFADFLYRALENLEHPSRPRVNTEKASGRIHPRDREALTANREQETAANTINSFAKAYLSHKETAALQTELNR